MSRPAPTARKPELDFLPTEYREASGRRKRVGWRAIVTVLFVAAVGSASAVQYSMRLGLQRELEQFRQQSVLVEAQAARVAALEHDVAAARHRAELVTFLRHPWPRTQILDAVVARLPDGLVLTSLRLFEEPLPAGAEARVLSVEGQAVNRTPAERDLDRLRGEAEARRSVVLLEGTTDDAIALHRYLGELAECDLFAQTELTSLAGPDDRDDDEGEPAPSRFMARLVLRPAWGHPAGPVPSEPAAPPATSESSLARGVAP